jgi:hypothetical protein
VNFKIFDEKIISNFCIVNFFFKLQYPVCHVSVWPSMWPDLRVVWSFKEKLDGNDDVDGIYMINFVIQWHIHDK